MKMSRWLSPFVLVLAALPSIRVQGQQPLPGVQLPNTHYVNIVHAEELSYGVAQVVGLQGAVVLSVSIDQEGRASTVSVLAGEGLLVDAARENLKKLRLYPAGQKDGTLVFGFRLESCPEETPRKSFEVVQPNFVLISGCYRIANR